MATKATVNALGIALTVDSACQVLLQSLDDPLCETIGAGAQASIYGQPMFVAIAVTVVIVLLMVTTVAVIVIKRRVLKKA